MEELVLAYYDCRRAKRNTRSAMEFERDLEYNLRELYDELIDGSYRPGRSICFVIQHPKPREVWAANYRDRIVHHLLYNRIGRRFEASFIADSCACIPGRGTLYAAQRLEHHIRSATQNWRHPGFYLKCDVASFFVSIDKRPLADLLARKIVEPWWLSLAELILFHDPRGDVEIHSTPAEMALIPPHKSLFNQPAHMGLPIGNLTSQFFANVLLDPLDQFVKHGLRGRRYVRYVDDLVLVHSSREWLADALDRITAFLPERLHLQLNPSKTVTQPIARGVDFVGQVVKPWRRMLRRKTLNVALRRLEQMSLDDLFASGNSYLGLTRQTTHGHADRVRIAKLLLRRGHAVDWSLTKAYHPRIEALPKNHGRTNYDFQR